MKKFLNYKSLRLLRKKYRHAVNILIMIVVFATTYALILPAITLDQEKASQTAGIRTAEDSSEAVASQVNTESTEEATDTSKVGSESDLAANSESSSAQTESSNQENSNTHTQTEASESAELITEPTTFVHKTDQYELTASFDASAKLPQGVELRVKELESDSKQYREHYEKAKETLSASDLNYARFLDISFVYNDQEVEPAAPVQIKLKNETTLQLKEDSKLKIVHFESEQDVKVIESSTKEENQQISEVNFESDSFSVYGYVAADYYTVNFIYQDDTGTEQVITSLIDKVTGSKIGRLPEAPFRNGYTFSHWQNKETKEKVDENTPITQNMTVEAVFNRINIYTIDVTYYYHNNSKNQDITIDKETVQIEPSDTPYQITPPASTEVTNKEDTSLPADAIYYPERAILEYTAESLEQLDLADGVDDNKISEKVQYIPYNAQYDVVYMLKDLTGNGYSQIQTVNTKGVLGSTVTPQVLTYAYADFEKSDTAKITQTSGQKLYVYYTRKIFTLSYNSNGGSNISQQTALYDSQVKVSTVSPTKEGYDFAGWYDNPQLSGSAVSSNIQLKKDTVLYAKWTPKTVAYTIVYYKQEYDNTTQTTKYVYDSAQSSTAKVGTTVSATNAPAIATAAKYWEKDTAANASSSVEIAPDGSSVLKVYYQLKRYTFVFNLNGPYYDYSGYTSGRIFINGRTYWNSNYTISNVVLGQDISSLWPSSSSEVYDSYNYRSFDYWIESWSKTKRFEVTSDLLDQADSSNNIQQTARWINGGTQASVEYWLQSADNPNVYEKSEKYSQSFVNTSGLNPKDIFGYTYLNYTPSGYSGSQYWGDVVYRFYYDRTKYKIDYYYNGSLLKSTGQTVPFERNINTATYNYTPSRPAGVDADYTWGGWYADAGLTTPYTFSTMPRSNVALYANWVAPKFNVTFDTAGADTATPATQVVEKYKYAKAPSDPTRQYYNFLGWYTDDGKLFNWTDQITKDTKLTAKWELKPLSYTVRYLEAGTNNKLAADKQVTSPALALNQSITENALGITGYRPNTTTQTIQLNYDNNVITFYYSPKAAEVTYTIKYVLKDHPTIEVAPTKTMTVDGSIIRAKEEAVSVNKEHMKTQAGVTADMLATDYYPTENTKSLILTSSAENNVIVFEYLPYDTKAITVNYLDMDGDAIVGQDPLVVYQKKPGTFLLDRKAIDGYTYDHSVDSENAKDKVLYQVTDGGQVTINLYYKKNLTISAVDKTKVYDGTALTSSGLGDIDSSYDTILKSGDKLTKITYTGTQTDAGVSPTTPKEAKITDANGKDRTNFYHITYQPGTLTVEQQPVSVIIDGEKKVKTYDGQKATVSYKITEIADTSGLFKESYIQFNGTDADKKVEATNAGTYPLNLQGRFSNTNPNFKVEFHVSDGQLLIEKRKLTLTSSSATKAYDATELTDKNLTVEAPAGADYTGFVKDEGVVPEFTGKQTNPGMSLNTFSYTPKGTTNLNNYEIVTQFGKLTVQETINLQKTSLDWTALSGGAFEVAKWDGTNWAAIPNVDEVKITSTDGTNIPVGLEPGRYWIQETAAPDGFVVLESFVYFTITEEMNGDGTASQYTVKMTDEAGNEVNPDKARLSGANGTFSHRIQIANEQGKALPHTGGEGTISYIGLGLILMAGAFVLRQWLLRRKKG